MAAERMAVAVARAGLLPYPAADLERAWLMLLYNQFHDILAGSSIEPAYEDARDQLGESKSIAQRALNHAAQAIAARIDT
ncbi:MAG: hypothetical protein M1457_03430, partial [bacterium]|nr:hypothetical protein [bacterium]